MSRFAHLWLIWDFLKGFDSKVRKPGMWVQNIFESEFEKAILFELLRVRAYKVPNF